MIIYVVNDVEGAPDGEVACETVREARQLARGEGHKTFTKIWVAKMTARKLACALFNREGFAVNRKEITV